jgi:hypothetical protein
LKLELTKAIIGLIEELDVRFFEQIVYDAMGIVYPLLAIGKCKQDFSKTFEGAEKVLW